MKRRKIRLFIALHVLLPLLCGGLLYLFFGSENTALGHFLTSLHLPVGFLKAKVTVPAFLIFHLPDALWAYAFCASLLLIWRGRNAAFATVAAFVLCAGYEGLQYFSVVGGTFDWYDILWMSAACAASYVLTETEIK